MFEGIDHLMSADFSHHTYRLPASSFQFYYFKAGYQGFCCGIGHNSQTLKIHTAVRMRKQVMDAIGRVTTSLHHHHHHPVGNKGW